MCLVSDLSPSNDKPFDHSITPMQLELVVNLSKVESTKISVPPSLPSLKLPAPWLGFSSLCPPALALTMMARR